MNQELINTLKKLDLTTYEAKAYLTLNSIITGTAIEISKKSQIPRAKIYDTLKTLNKKNFIEIKQEKPLKYTVIPPKIAFTQHKQELIKTLSKTEEKLIEIHEKKISQIQAPVWLIPTEEKITNKEIELIKSAKTKINMRIGFLTENELELLIKTFKKTKQHVKIKILANKEIYTNKEKINIIQELQSAKIKNLKIQETNLPFVKLIIKDKKEMFHIYAKQDFELKTPIIDSLMGVWNLYEEVTENYDERFEKQFKAKERKTEKIKILK